MKFEYNKEKYADLGLIVKHGNSQNVVFFWDEVEDAASYVIEIYRYVGDRKFSEGFMDDNAIYLTVNHREAKPVCAVSVERNKFYYSINDLPYGGYIVCLKVEDRSGEIFRESKPYYFHIEDAEKVVTKQAENMAAAVLYSGGMSHLG